MKTDAAIALCLKYSEDPATLTTLIERLNITATAPTVIPSPWAEGLQALHYRVTVEGYAFSFHGSHADAQTMQLPSHNGDFARYRTRLREHRLAKQKATEGLLYSLLCCISGDLATLHSDPEELGYNPDSIKDMANWNTAKEHARKLSQALKLTHAELASLPQ